METRGAGVGAGVVGKSGQATSQLDERSIPPRRVVLLGASNVTRGISTVVETACRVWGRPLDLLAAIGHGRSYGMKSTVLVRTLPGIIDCGLWQALAERPPASTAALVTDIGNDLFYGAAPPQIAGWVEVCVDRLAKLGAAVVMTRMPVCNLDHVRDWQYRAVRSVMFPGCTLTFAEITERAMELDARLTGIARQRGCRLVEPNACWYGFDPIHIKMRHWGSAWSAVLAPWSETSEASACPVSLRRWLRLARFRPQRRWVLGREQARSQPCGHLPDGTVVSLY